jgi:long-chain acyl-CoA synthetase
MNIAQNIERAAKLFPDKAAIVFEGTQLTYNDLNARVNRLASTLVAKGISKGDRVALYLPNIPAFVIAYLASVRIGAIAVSVNAMLKAEELTYIINDAEAVLLLTVGELLENVNLDDYPQLRQIVVCEGGAAGHPTLDDWLNAGQELFAA